jgi:hypothetical protein
MRSHVAVDGPRLARLVRRVSSVPKRERVRVSARARRSPRSVEASTPRVRPNCAEVQPSRASSTLHGDVVVRPPKMDRPYAWLPDKFSTNERILAAGRREGAFYDTPFTMQVRKAVTDLKLHGKEPRLQWCSRVGLLRGWRAGHNLIRPRRAGARSASVRRELLDGIPRHSAPAGRRCAGFSTVTRISPYKGFRVFSDVASSRCGRWAPGVRRASPDRTGDWVLTSHGIVSVGGWLRKFSRGRRIAGAGRIGHSSSAHRLIASPDVSVIQARFCATPNPYLTKPASVALISRHRS